MSLFPKAVLKQLSQSAVRYIMSGISATMLVKGVGTEELWASITAGVLALVVVAWSYFGKKKVFDKTNTQIDAGVA